MPSPRLSERETPSWLTLEIGGQCPLQGFGDALGHDFYFRARGEHWSFEVSADPARPLIDDADPSRGDLYVEEPWGDGPYDAGYMHPDEGRYFIVRELRKYMSRLYPDRDFS